MNQTVTVIESNLPVSVLKSNLIELVKRLVVAQDEKNRQLEKEIYLDMTYYEEILYKKVSIEEYMAFQDELDELR